MKTLQQIEKDVAARARRLTGFVRDLPTYGVSHDGARPHIEVSNSLYHFVVVERGEELQRLSSDNYDDLLYWIFSGITHSMAFSYEVPNRVENQDIRRIAFPAQIELMKQISPAFGERLERHIADILQRAPYNDEPTKALNLVRQDGSSS